MRRVSGSLLFFGALVALALTAGCYSSPSSGGGPCGLPPPVLDLPPVVLGAPANGATGVSDSFSLLIVQGFGPPTLLLTSSAGKNVPLGPSTALPTAAPTISPLPVPTASSQGSFWSATISSSLDPATTYIVGEQYSEWSSTPPCTAIRTVNIGSFTTQ